MSDVPKNAAVLLYGLLKGYPVYKGGQKFLMDEDFILCQEAESENTKTGEKKTVYLKVNMGIELQQFIQWANSFTEVDISENVSNFLLNDIRRRDV